MPKIDGADFETLMRVLPLLALLFYLAPGAFGPKFAVRNRPWMHRAAVVTMATGLVIALAASLAWFLN